jgi:hypothetical protein
MHPLAATTQKWYMHDGAPIHFSHAVQDAVNNTYHDQRISTEGPNAWTLILPDLNSLYF